MKTFKNMQNAALTVAIVSVATMTSFQAANSRAVISPQCMKYACHCISTNGASQGGFSRNGNIGIEIVSIDQRVTGVTLSYSSRGAPFYSRRPSIGDFIRINRTVYTKAYAPRVGLGCAVQYHIIDNKGGRRR